MLKDYIKLWEQNKICDSFAHNLGKNIVPLLFNSKKLNKTCEKTITISI